MRSDLFGLEVTNDGRIVPVEAPRCSEALDIPHADVHLTCDRPAGHLSPHRTFLRHSPPYAVGWCDDKCAEPCPGVRGWLRTLREQGLTIVQNRKV